MQQSRQASFAVERNDMVSILDIHGSCDSLQEPDATLLNAAAEHCRGLLGDKGVQQGAMLSRDCTQHSSEGIGKRWQSVAGCGLSSLAPHDLHAESAVTRIMPRWVLHTPQLVEHLPQSVPAKHGGLSRLLFRGLSLPVGCTLGKAFSTDACSL